MGGEGCDHDNEIRKFIPLSESKIKVITVSELKLELRRRGVKPNPKGNRLTLRYHLTKAIDKNKTIQTKDDATAKFLVDSQREKMKNPQTKRRSCD